VPDRRPRGIAPIPEVIHIDRTDTQRRNPMPLFEYQCNQCQYGFDKIVSKWDAEVKCPLCQGKVAKKPSTFAVGGAHPKSGALPAGMGPKMCSNC
jgi:putative FmdB family regulatory protein